MRQPARDQRTVWLAKYAGKAAQRDSQGHLTGDYAFTYGKPFSVTATLSPSDGNATGNAFGVGVDLDRTCIVCDVGLGLSVTSVAWVGAVPELDDDGALKVDGLGNATVPYDHRVVMVAESNNVTSIALKGVE